jgi:hypothetical protein
MGHGKAPAWVIRAFWLATAFTMAEACSSNPPGSGENVGEAQSAVFTNGGFETGAAGMTPPSWTVTPYLNNGITVQTPQTLTGLNLLTTLAGHSAPKQLTEILVSATGPLTQIDPDLGATASLRWPRYGNQCAIVNDHSSTNFDTPPNSPTGNGQNVNAMTQTMIIGSGDVDPADHQIHVRFTVAPVLQNPAHAANDQPYYLVQFINLTQGMKLLYSDFNLSGAAGIPWKTINGGTANEIDYTDWQLVDIAPVAGSIAMGDSVELDIIASGCQPGGHFGEIYVDGVGSTVPGLFVSGTGPAQANPCSDITYTLTYENGDPVTPAAGVVVTFNTPPQTTYASINAPGLVCTTPTVGMAGAVVCTVPTPVAPGASGSFQVTVALACNASGIVTAGNYFVQGTGITPLLGPHVNTTVGCTLDSQCPPSPSSSNWCDVSQNACTPTVANGLPVPTDGEHGTPVLNGTCTAAAGTLTCTSGVCDTKDNDCGYANGDGPCVPGASSVCRSGVCDTDMHCGYANGDGPCVPGTSVAVCRSTVCDGDMHCGYANGDGPCTQSNGPTVCRSSDCSEDGNCQLAGDCQVDADCSSTQYCNTPTSMCVPKVASGLPVPTVPGHDMTPGHMDPTLNGTCTTAAAASACASGVCDDDDNECGYDVGHGPCTPGPDPVCQSGMCSTGNVCEPTGGCITDADCTAPMWCDESMHTCNAQLINGKPIPNDPPHTSPTLDDTCTTAAAMLVCQSGVCDTKDNGCGYANGDGTCNSSNGDTVCRSGICATSGTNMGVCVACVMDSQCAAPTPMCNTTTNTCIQCTMSSQCPSEDPICNTTTGTCVPCNGDFGSSATEPCGTMGEPFCFLSGAMTGECGKCSTNADCAGHSGNICDTTSGLCVSGCVTDADCLGSQWCNAPATGTGMCEAKIANGNPLPSSPSSVATCTPAVGMRVCLSGVCDTKDNECGYATGDGPCDGNTECRDGVCNLGTGTCGESDAGTPCVGDTSCPVADFCATNGMCTPKEPLGGACTRANECQSGDCTSSVCNGIVASGNGLICSVRDAGSSGGEGSAGMFGLLLALAGAGLARRRK